MNFLALKICFLTLLLYFFKVSRATESVDISSDFKVLLMYFSEAFLRGAVFDGIALEGEISLNVAHNFVEAIERVETEYSEMPDLEDLVLFKTQLSAGIPIALYILISQSGNDYNTLKNEALAVQEKFIVALEQYGGVIMPIGWVEHTIYLVMRKGKVEGTFDFSIINTGQGSQYHHHSADPNGVYPNLTQIWMEFKNVPPEEIFTTEAWFFYGLIALRKEDFKSNLKRLFTPSNQSEYSEYFSEYFYGSFLVNFKNHLVPPRNDKLFTMQRSGSCTLSSLIGALLYTSKSEETFYLHRLKIGHALTKSFLVKAQSNDRFKGLIQDGFETNGRNFLKVITSSMAQKTLEYLEFALPDHFKHAGLVGSERFKWIFEKKEAANKALMEANPVVLKSVQISIELINEIISFLNDNPICMATNDIVLKEEFRNQFKPLRVNFRSNYDGRGKKLSKDIYALLKGTSNRLEVPLISFDQFYQSFKLYGNPMNVDMELFYRVLNIFQRAHNLLKDDSWLEGVMEPQLLELQKICKKLAFSFSSLMDKFRSFDDVVLLAYLQKLIWKLAVAYDNRLPEEMKIGLESFAAPQTIQRVLFRLAYESMNRVEVNVLTGNLKKFIIHNCFDQRNVEIFMDLMKEDETENGKPIFMGPESFCDLNSEKFMPKIPSGMNGRLYEKMMGHPVVENIFQELVQNGSNLNKWKNIDPRRGKFIIVFSKGQCKLFEHFPHYYNLMDTLALVRIGPIDNIPSKSRDWVISDINDTNSDPDVVTQAFTSQIQDIQYLKNSYFEIIKNGYYRNEKIFYCARHSLALTRNIDITNIETWLNYIKSSSSAKLFDSKYFQYMTDHLLNVPKFESPQMIMFPVDDLMARLIIKELSTLIRISLDTIKKLNQQLSSEKRRILIMRSVNVSVILIRFISRIDAGNILNGSECAELLAQIYNLFIPFVSSKSSYLLAEQEIARINFALGHICTVTIRNELTFMNSIYLETIHKGYRKTLKRYHWFVSRRSFILNGVGTSVADDQYNYGVSGNPMSADETNFLKELLISYFLPGLINEPSESIATEYIFKYNYELYLVNILNQINGRRIIINLWTGAIVLDGWSIINNNVFINSEPFQNFFTRENLPLVSNGLAAENGGTSIYALPDFKGSSYMISREFKYERFSFSDDIEIKINRKWNGNWYELTTFEDIKNTFQCVSLEYDWIENDSWIFKREFGRKSREIIIILKNDINPVIRFIEDETTSTMKVAVDEFIEGNEWTVLSLKEQRKITIFSRPNNEPLRIYLFQRHFESFTRGAYILAKDELDQFVVICMNLRFPEDMRRPIVFREKLKITEETMATGFEVLNLQKTEIFSNQSLSGSSSLPGGLVIISDSKKALILPNALKLENKKTTVQVEKIPISDDNLAPQAREHKLLLAYYMILQLEFNSARKLLHPSASINHNEVFSIKEINILQWITEINLEAPEALALKLFAYIHYAINSEKFSFDHEKNSLPKIFAPKTIDYLYAIREMSEKYYIFLIFPEALKEPLFSRLFAGSLGNAPTIPNPSCVARSPYIYIPTSSIRTKPYFSIGSRLGYSFTELILDGNKDQMRLASKLILRRDHKDAFISDSEMALMCYVKEPELWMEFEDKLLGLNNNNLSNAERDTIAQQSREIYVKVMKTCMPKYADLFKGMDQCSNISMTSFETLKSTFEAETNRLRLKIANQIPKQENIIDLVCPDDAHKILNVEMMLRSRLNFGNEKKVLLRFNAEDMKNSSVLKKLQKSIEDFVEENGQSSQSEINLNDDVSTLNDFKTFLFNLRADITTYQEEATSELSKQLNADKCSSAIGSILNSMHQKKVKTFESLFACYFTDSLVCIQKKFPQLNLQQCMEVEEKAKIFYGRHVLINYLRFLEENLESFLDSATNNMPVSADDLAIFCDELSKIKDFNSRMKDPVIMNFEFRSQKYRLKPEQVKDVGLLTTVDQNSNSFPSVVIQRMMAAGKTLVLGTISVVKKALDNTQLSILVPPSSLYQSNTTAMQTNTYKFFKKKGINFTFPRFEMPSDGNSNSTKILASYLKTIYEIITSTMNDNNYMILSPETLHSFLNSYIEALLSAENIRSQFYQDILKSYAQIYRIFKQRGSIILDEIDMTMDPKKELNFPTQETEPYNMAAVTMLTDIMEFMIFDQEIINSGLRIHSNNQASLTASGYRICVRKVLDYVRNQLENPTSIWYYLVYGSNSHGESVNNIMDFLADPNMAGGEQWITTFHKSGNQVIANALIIVKNQLHCHMEHSLKGTVNLNFGSARSLRPEIKFAVPYAAANTPSAASVFADRWETLLKTLLMVSASPCSSEIAMEFIEYTRITITSESAITKSLEKTVTYRNLKHILPTDLCPLSLDSRNVLHVEAVQEALSTRSPAAIRLLFTFYITEVFDKMTFPTEQITSNALNVASMFNSVQGYSGTIDNVNILPQHVVKKAFEDNLRNEKNNGGISLKLVKDCDDGFVQELNEEAFTKSAEDMVKDLMSLYPSENVTAIIDSGAFFKNFKNIEVARAILTIFEKFKVVLYYDEDSNRLEFIRSSNKLETPRILESSDLEYIRAVTEVEMEERFTFYDQRHITGSDIHQPKTAHAIMTFGPRILLRDILQGALRMRRFMTSQKVHLVTTRASRKFYESKIKKDEENRDQKMNEVELENDAINESVMEAIGAEEEKTIEAKEVKIEVEETRMIVSDVLKLGAFNEDEKQEHENVKLAFGKIDAEIRAFVIDEISRALVESRAQIIRDYILDMVKCGKPLFLRSIKEVPLNWLQESKFEDAAYILNLFAISRLHSLSKVMKNFASNIELQQRFNSLKIRIKYMIARDNEKYYYAKKTIRTPINFDEGTEVQQQTLTLTMVDLNMDVLMDKYNENEEQVHNYNLLPTLKHSETDEALNSSFSVYLSLKDLYNGICSNEMLRPYLDNTLVTLGDRAGVTQDLIKIFKLSSWMNKNNEYPIFSKWTFEGTHILVQLNGRNLKVILISSKHASSILKELNSSYAHIYISSKFWLCDLSGSVTATNDADTERGQNVLDFIPKIDNLIFDLLVFNGSLSHILGNHKLKKIYANWLSSENFEKRAIFLRLRMKVLMEKDKEIFEIDDENLGLLKKFSLGIKTSNENVVDGYPKEAIEENFETEKMGMLNITSRSQKALGIGQANIIDFDFDLEIKKLLNITGYEESKTAAPEFFFEPENITAHDFNLDEREITSIKAATREEINISEYPMAVKKVYVDVVEQEQVKEILEREITIEESMSEYQEPALIEIEPIRTTEISVYPGLN